MTTGNYVSDGRSTVPTVSGDGKVGPYFSKVWNGADYPKQVKLRPAQKRTPLVYKARVGRKEIEMVQEIALPPIPDEPRRVAVEHPYTMSLTEERDQIFDARANAVQSYTPNRYGIDVFMDPGNFTGLWDSNDDLKLFGKLREKVAGSEFNLGVALGESREALGMILDTALRVRQAYTAVRRGRFDAARNFLVSGTARNGIGRKTTASNWLQLQYGWLPLLNDAEAGAQFLAHYFSVPLQQVVRVSREKKIAVVTNNFGYRFTNSDGYQAKYLKAILKEKDVVALAGLKDPLSVAWELLPYSFVIDWFIPIGNYLSARGLAQSLTGTFVTTFVSNYVGRGISSTQPQGSVKNPAEKVFHRSVSMTRTVGTSLDVKPPSAKSLASTASWQHTLNAVALLVNLKK